MAYTVARFTGLNYLNRFDGYSDFAAPLTIGGWFRQAAQGDSSYNGWMGLNRGNTNTQYWTFGISPGADFTAPTFEYTCAEGSSIDTHNAAVEYNENTWVFAALVAASDTSRTLYYFRPTIDTDVQSSSGNSDDISPSSVDSLSLGERLTDNKRCDVDCFQLGIANSAVSLAELRKWAFGQDTALSDAGDWTAGQDVSTISGLAHAYKLLTADDGSGNEFLDSIGSAHLSETGTVVSVTEPFTPSAGGGGISELLDLVTETDIALSIVPSIVKTLGTPIETDLSLDVIPSIVVPIPLVSEVNSALGLGVQHRYQLPIASEVESALPMIYSGILVFLDIAHGRELRDQNDTVWANVNGWQWAWYDDPDETLEGDTLPVATGTFNTNANGEVTSFPINGTGLSSGEIGGLLVRHPTDDTIQAWFKVPIGP